jgi:hypothetical protein
MFTEYATGEYELYDLVLDPDQMQSKRRAGNEQLYSTLQTRLNALRACSGIGCRNAEWDAGTTPPPDNTPPTNDTTAPKVTSTVPTANAAGVDAAADVTATFSEDMDGSFITGQTFKLFKKGSTTKIAATVIHPEPPASARMAILNPTNSLQSRVTYKAVVTTGAKDLAGNSLDQNSATTGSQQIAWFFTVR